MRSRFRQRQIALEVSFAPDVNLIHADRIQIEQVVVNLLLNAIDALQCVDGGTAEKRIIVEVDKLDSRYIAVAISDTGPPLSADVVERLFDPFFTTKAEGMGMGLSISRSIIEAHGGSIEYLLNENQLPTIRFRLPLI